MPSADPSADRRLRLAAGRRASAAAETVAAALARRRHARLLHPAGRPRSARR